MKQLFHITSSVNADTTGQVLSIRTGERHFGFSITSPRGDELYQLAWYTDTEMTEDVLREIYLKHQVLRDRFQQTLLGFDHPQSVLVPQHFYKQEDAQLLLSTMYGSNDKDTIAADEVPAWHLQNIYAVPADVYEWIRQHFPGSQWHGYTIGLKQVELTDFEGSLFVDFRTDDFTVMISKANKLLLAQTYPYAIPADVIYYLLNACQQFGLSQETVRVSLSGLIDKESALYRDLYQYFLHIRFREPNWLLQVADEDHPVHFFTALNDLARCAS